jgi:hypothetical protein
MRMYSLLAVFVLVTPAIYAQHSPAATSTPAPASHTSTTSSPAPSSSSSSSSSSSGGSAIHSSPSSTTSNSASSSSGAGSGSWNRHDRDSSRDSVSTGSRGSGSSLGSSSPAKRSDRDAPSPAVDAKTDTSRSRHHDPDQNKKATDVPLGGGGRTQIAKTPEDLADVRRRKCDKEPCPTPTPQPSRCPEGRPCEPCPPGTSPGEHGHCVASANPPPPPACAAGTVWNGAGCARPAAAPAYPTAARAYRTAAPAYPAATTASEPECIYYFSESTRISTEVHLARERVREACSNDPGSTKCRFAKGDEILAEQSCQILQTQIPANCRASIPNCDM